MPKIGQYIPGESFIHRLDPRIKIIATFLITVFAFLYSSWLSYIVLYLGIFIVILKTNVKFSNFLRTLRGIVFLLSITFFFNLFWSFDGEVIWSFWLLRITDKSLVHAVRMFLRLIIIVIASSIMTMTTQPMDLTQGLESLFSPLKKIGVPVGEMATMISIALRFVPILMTEAERIYKAQLSRGADFESGSLIERAKKLLPILVPLFAGALNRAEELSVAMESRCYVPGAKRTKRCPLKYRASDIFFISANIIILAGLFIWEKI